MRGLSPEGYGAVMRPEILFSLYSPITTLKGVGPRVAPLLERVAGPIVRDVLWLKPHSVVRRTTGTLADAIDGQVMTFDVVINDFQRPRTNAQPWRVRVADETGFLTLAFFGGFGGQLEQRHPVGARRLVSGRVEETKFGRQMVHPDYMVDPTKAEEIPEVEAIYPATEGLPPRRVRGFALEALAHAPDLPEWQDPAFVARERFPTWREALVRMHHPESDADLSPLSVHRRRLAYDELLAHQLAMAQRKAARRREPAPTIPTGELARKVRADLPFALTGAQERALADVHADFQAGERMSRLIQGDVGSGKTVVAMLAMADVAEAGGQSALMAPTEILARQHIKTITPLAERAGLRVAILTGREKGKERREILERLEAGEIHFLVGTHALIQDDVIFRALALAVVDEQHRFGVRERLALTSKGDAVDVLVLSATPIPRTLVLTYFGDMDVSELREKPAGRQPIDTRTVPAGRLDDVIDAVGRALKAGKLVYWICPLVEESEAEGTEHLTNATERFDTLQQRFGDRVGLVHGQMKGTEKDRVMAQFAAHEIKLLVATTVVEVGVDVPAASIMVIENAERFGLAQLHQLRGRIGRGSEASTCLLLYKEPLGEMSAARLKVIRETTDGFRIAEEDLKLRGEGDVLGTRQSGLPGFRVARIETHGELLQAARDDAGLVLARDPDLQTERGQALRTLLYLFSRDEAVRLLRAG